MKALLPQRAMRILSKMKQYNIAEYPLTVCFVLILLMTFLEIKLVSLIHNEHYKDLVHAAYGVVMGKPHWRAYQNRLLGPCLVQLVSQVTGWTFQRTFSLFVNATVALANFISFYAVLDLTKNRRISLKYAFYYSLFFLALQDNHWLYLWDLINLSLFFMFAYGIFKNWKMRFFAYLFVVCLLNREDALFVALWLVIDAFTYNRKLLKDFKAECSIINRSQLFIGIFLIVVGIVYTKFIRDLLFVESSLNGIGLDLRHAAIGEHITFFTNIAYLFNFWQQNNLNIIPAYICIVLTIYLCIKLRHDEFLKKIGWLFACMSISIFAFGRIGETRVFFMLIPFIMIINLKLSNQIRTNH